MADVKLVAEWFWVDRWTGSSAFGLPMEARGIYREMLTQAWRRGASLPAPINHQTTSKRKDYSQICRLIGCTKREWNRSWKFVEPYWTIERIGDECRLVNHTQQEVYRAAVERTSRASEHGRTAALARARALPEHNPGTARAVPEIQPPISTYGRREDQGAAELPPESAASPAPRDKNLLSTSSPGDVVATKQPRRSRASRVTETTKAETEENAPGALIATDEEQDGREAKISRPRASSRRQKPSEPPSPQVKDFLAWFQVEYKTRRHGADYYVHWQRDAPIVKRLLFATPLERLKICAQILLSDKTENGFIEDTDRSIGILSTQFNWLSDRLAQWEARNKNGQ